MSMVQLAKTTTPSRGRVLPVTSENSLVSRSLLKYRAHSVQARLGSADGCPGVSNLTQWLGTKWRVPCEQVLDGG